MMPWWQRRSLRLRLSVLHMLAMLVVLVVYVGCLLLVLNRSNSRGLDERLRSDFRWATEMATQGPDGSLTWFETSTEDEELPWLQVWTPKGDLLFKTAAVDRLPIPQSRDLAVRADNSIAVVPRGVPVRVLSGASSVAGRPVVIQVARSEALIRQSLSEMALILLVGLPLAVAVAGAGGYSLARRALAPVGNLADRTRAITAERLGDRLTADNEHDELGRLTAVINAMLERLETSFAQMRRFTSDVSHQVRTPLTAMRSEAEVALLRDHDAAEYRGVILSMLEEVDRLGNLVDQLLSLSRAESGQAALCLEDVDLAQLAGQVTSHLSVLAEEKGQTLTVQPEAAPHCQGDRGVLRQALINLVDNAIKYTPHGGSITMKVFVSGKDAVIDVIDTGRGVPAEATERVFERFYRHVGANNTPDGLGLGLAIAKWAAEVNGGRLTVQRNPVSGSTFRLALPRAVAVERGGHMITG